MKFGTILINCPTGQGYVTTYIDLYSYDLDGYSYVEIYDTTLSTLVYNYIFNSGNESASEYTLTSFIPGHSYEIFAYRQSNNFDSIITNYVNTSGLGIDVFNEGIGGTEGAFISTPFTIPSNIDTLNDQLYITLYFSNF